MKKYFVCSDIHSFYDEWMSALADKEFDRNNPDHILVVVGDLMDRGPKTNECLEFVNSLPDERVVLIRGNHEDLLEDALQRGCFYSHDYSNGTFRSCVALSGLDMTASETAIAVKASENESLKEYLSKLVPYAEIGDYIFIHGWIPCHYQRVGLSFYSVEYDPNWRNARPKVWHEQSRWANGMDMWAEGVREPGKTIVCGHWHCSYGNSKYHNDGVEFLDDGLEPNPEQGLYENFNTFKDDGIMAIDACTAYSGKVNCEVIEIEDEEGKNEGDGAQDQRAFEAT